MHQAIYFNPGLDLIQTIHTDKEPTIKRNKIAMLYRGNFIARENNYWSAFRKSESSQKIQEVPDIHV